MKDIILSRKFIFLGTILCLITSVGRGGGGGGGVGGWWVTSYIWHSTDVQCQIAPLALPGI